MKKKYVIGGCLLALVGGLCGCGKKIPSDVIQPEVMEPLLYDYHLATTLVALTWFTLKTIKRMLI